MKDAFSANFVDLLFALSSFQKMESLLCKSKLSKEDQERLKKSRNDEESELIFQDILTNFRSNSDPHQNQRQQHPLSVPYIFRRIIMMTNELDEEMKNQLQCYQFVFVYFSQKKRILSNLI